MATTSRDALITTSGEIELAHALDQKMRRLFSRSLRLRVVAAGSCGGCEGELAALGNVVFDMARFGIQFVASPRHADGIVIAGAVSTNMRDALERTYAAVADPRLVIAVGACAVSGGTMDLATLIKPILTAGDLRVILAVLKAITDAAGVPLAASDLAAMSPKPTVEKTVTLKYRASVRVSGWVKFAAEARSITKYVEANSSR